MKKLILTTICTFLVALSLLGQAPQAFKYQAIARDVNGDILANRPIALQISILEGDENGSILYCEMHTATTNSFGLVNLEIGKGERPSHEFNTINWALGNLFLKMEMDENGGTNFKPMGVSPLLSVPYALYAAESGNGGSRKKLWDDNGDDVYNANSGNVGIGTQTPVSQLEVIGVITAVGGNSDEWNEAYSWGDHSIEGYLTSETDPEVGDNTTDYLPKWDGSSLVTGSIYDNGSVAIGTANPEQSAAFEVKSSDKGFLPPRLTTAQRDEISSPSKGLIVYNTEDDLFQGYNGSVWQSFSMTPCVPIQPTVIYGPESVGCKAPGIGYSIDPIANTLSYTWSVPVDATITSGQGTTDIIVDFWEQSGQVSVYASNGCGNSESQGKDITLEVPPQPGQISGPIDPEEGATGIIYSINPVNGALTYSWTVPDGAIITNGQGTTSITVNFGSAAGFITVYASNDCGSSSIQELQIWFYGTVLIDPRDGQVYSTVLIGDQIWMAENLNIGTMIDGVQDASDNGIIEKYCYENNESNCDVYGAIYTWYEMMEYLTTEGTQGICPDGWHIPTNGEWTILTDYLGGESVAGGKMKEGGTYHWCLPNFAATNSSGFTGLPGGNRAWNGEFHDLTKVGVFMSSTKIGGADPLNRDLRTWFEHIVNGFETTSFGFSVRCLKN